MKRENEKKEQLQGWSKKEYISQFRGWIMKLGLRFFQHLLFFIPLKKNCILIYSLKQKGYSCNLKYLDEYIRTYEKETFDVTWIVNRSEDYECLKERGIPVEWLHSKEHFRLRHKAGIVITNDEFYAGCIKRRGQRYVNTWHGGINYKKIGYEGVAFASWLQKHIFKMSNPQPDCFLAGSQSFLDSTSKAFHFSQDVFFETGLPRNDVLVNENEEKKEKVRNQFELAQEDRVLLYAPTFRSGGISPETKLDFATLKNVLEERFGGNWKIFIRQHYFVEVSEEKERGEWIRDVSEEEDMQELMLISDAMISDYSSCMWDFSLTGRPCFVLAEDLRTYEGEDRSFFVLPDIWPYPISESSEELYGKIRHFDKTEYEEKVKKHHKEMGNFERGKSCENVLKILKEYVRE